jgi:dihydropyrimidinase
MTGIAVEPTANCLRFDTVKGSAVHTLRQGNLVWTNGELRTVKGSEKNIKRPAYGTALEATNTHSALNEPKAEVRNK